MHSLSLAENIMQTALDEAARHGDAGIKAISVVVGWGASAESDSLQFCLEALARGTIAEGARITVEPVAPFDEGTGEPQVPSVEPGHQHHQGYAAGDVLSLRLELG